MTTTDPTTSSATPLSPDGVSPGDAGETVTETATEVVAPDPRPAGPDDVLSRRRKLGLAMAAAILTATVAAVVTLGVVPFPETPPVSEVGPPVTGRLAFLAWGDDGQCLHVLDGRGTDTVLECGAPLRGDRVGWTEDGYVTLAYHGEGATWHQQIIDPVTGGVVETRAVDESGFQVPGGPDGGPIWRGGEGWTARFGDLTYESVRTGRQLAIVARTPEGSVEVIWEDTAPTSYRFDRLMVSPDGAWLGIRDSRDQLLVLPTDGSSGPRLWAEDVGWEFAWFIRGAGVEG